MLQICERSDDLFIEIPTEIHSSNVSALLNSYIIYVFLKKDSYSYASSICSIFTKSNTILDSKIHGYQKSYFLNRNQIR